MTTVTPDSQLQMRLRALSASLHGRGVSVLHHGPDDNFDLAENLPPAWPSERTIGLAIAAALPEPLAGHYSRALALCRAGDTPEDLDFELSDGLRRQQFRAQFLPDLDGITVLLTDITEERSREAAVAALLREVSHRSKNLLAIVQSVAMQTAQHSTTIKDFLDKFRGRLHALSSTQDLVTDSDWRGTHLQSLVSAQLSRVGTQSIANVRITGENPILGPNAALHVGLAIHELAANAAIYGALSPERNGHIWVDAHYAGQNGGHPDLIIEWQETGLELPDDRRPPRFGTMVLERIVPLSVGGSAQFELAPDRVSYRLVIPGDQFEP